MPAVCTVHNELIEPAGETVSMVTKIFIKLRNWLSGNKPITNADKGMVGNALDVLCGDKTKENHNYGLLEGFRKLFFGETSEEVLRQNKKKEVYGKVLNDLYEKIDNKEFENNNVLVISTDFTNPNKSESVVHFSKTLMNLKYPQPVEEYFKDIKR